MLLEQEGVVWADLAAVLSGGRIDSHDIGPSYISPSSSSAGGLLCALAGLTSKAVRIAIAAKDHSNFFIDENFSFGFVKVGLNGVLLVLQLSLCEWLRKERSRPLVSLGLWLYDDSRANGRRHHGEVDLPLSGVH